MHFIFLRDPASSHTVLYPYLQNRALDTHNIQFYGQLFPLLRFRVFWRSKIYVFHAVPAVTVYHCSDLASDAVAAQRVPARALVVWLMNYLMTVYLKDQSISILSSSLTSDDDEGADDTL
jgi:hypothetical protein